MRRVPILILLAGCLVFPGCFDKPDAFFAPLIVTPLAGDVQGTILLDGEPLQGAVEVNLIGGQTNFTITVTDGDFSFGNVPAGDYTVTITPPGGVQCITNSQQVTVDAGGTADLTFQCTDGIPSTAQIAGPWSINYNAFQSTCGQINPFVSPATIFAQNGDLSAEFDDAPPGGEIVGPYDDQTGAFNGITQVVQIPNQPGVFGQEAWNVLFSTTVAAMDIQVTLDGTSDVVFTDNNNQFICNINYNITGERQ